MAILDFFSKEKREIKRVERIVKRANNKFTPKDYRQIALAEMIELATAGDAQALAGMLARFGVNADPSIEDEQEKERVCLALIDIGLPAVPQIRKTMRSAESVTWAHRALRHIVDLETYKKELLDVLADFDTEYERNPDRKAQTITALADIPERQVAEALVRFLFDVDETVRFQTVVALARLGDELAREPMLKVLCEDESLRVRNEAIDTFCKLGWETTGAKKKIPELLPAGYRLDGQGRIQRLG